MRAITDALRSTMSLLPGQARNRAGGAAWVVDGWARLDRFLILGSAEPTYYATSRELTLQAADAVVGCLAEDGPRAVDRVVAISDAGRAPSNDPALFALAMALKLGDPPTRARAREALPSVARTLAHLYRFAEAVQALGGWGRGTKAAFRAWFAARDAEKLVYQAIKYRQREGWTLRDLLRLTHPRAASAGHQALYAWATGAPADPALVQLEAFVRLQSVTDPEAAAALIRAHDLPREAVPTGLLGERGVWDALLERMPLTAMIRSLGKISAVGLLVGGSEAERVVLERLGARKALAGARVHPIALLSAHRVYRQGHGELGKLAWAPLRSVVNGLDDAFYLAFTAVRPTGLRQLHALDVSGSMGGGPIRALAGLTPREASAALAMVAVRTEDHALTMGFSHRLAKIDLRPGDRLGAAIDRVAAVPMGATDCALPMLHATRAKLAIDTFVVYTDNETWASSVHPAKALVAYREASGIPAKLVVVAMTADKFSIADPADGGMLDVVGFDAGAPAVIADFAARGV